MHNNELWWDISLGCYGIVALKEALSMCTSVTYLDLSNLCNIFDVIDDNKYNVDNNIGDEGAISVAVIVSHMSSLQVLHLNSLMLLLGRRKDMKTTISVMREQVESVINCAYLLRCMCWVSAVWCWCYGSELKWRKQNWRWRCYCSCW